MKVFSDDFSTVTEITYYCLGGANKINKNKIKTVKITVTAPLFKCMLKSLSKEYVILTLMWLKSHINEKMPLKTYSIWTVDLQKLKHSWSCWWLFQNVDIISDSDDAIARMITQMKEAVEVRKESLYHLPFGAGKVTYCAVPEKLHTPPPNPSH